MYASDTERYKCVLRLMENLARGPSVSTKATTTKLGEHAENAMAKLSANLYICR